MVFLAQIRQFSQIYRLWRAHHRNAGEVNGVTFRLVKDRETHISYVSGQLSTGQVEALLNHPDVQIETMGEMTVPLDLPSPEAAVIVHKPRGRPKKVV